MSYWPEMYHMIMTEPNIRQENESLVSLDSTCKEEGWQALGWVRCPTLSAYRVHFSGILIGTG